MNKREINRLRANAGRVLWLPILLSVAISLSCGQVAAQLPTQFAAKLPAQAMPGTVPETLPAANVSDSGVGNRVSTRGAIGTPSEGPSTEGGVSNRNQSQFRIERVPLTGGAELLTIFGRLDGMRAGGLPMPEVPLVSVVRDTLSDGDPENDRLRYVWMLTYTQPTMMKRIASAIPFLYQHVGNKQQASKDTPTPILDLANTRKQTWDHFFWTGLQNIFLDSYGIPLKAASRSYRRNASEYRKDHIAQALSILNNYENVRQRSRHESEMLAFSLNSSANSKATDSKGVDDTATPLLPERAPAFTPGEMLELRARLILSGKTFGGLFGPGRFTRTVENRLMGSVDTIGHNWEMLRQRAEAEGLYFQPLAMPDGHPSHALLWISRSDLTAQANRSFDKRFLNIADPWNDGRLRNWNGFVQTLYFDQENRPTTVDNPRARKREMIPLALYGLDYPKIPALLVDFRDTLNPKGREISRRVLNDVTQNILSLSSFGNLPYFLGRYAFDFITGRRGMDLNQPTRLDSYSELKLLLSFNDALDPKLRREIERHLEVVSVNPLSNDNQSEIKLAREQYDALIEYARRADGLTARIERARQAEMMPLRHGTAARIFLNLGNVLSFGRYVHRETLTPELTERMELARRIDRNTQYLSEVAKSSPQTEVAWDINVVKRSLQFLADSGAGANGTAAHAASLIFQRTNDAEARRLCLDALYKINSRTAKNELLLIYRAEQPHSEWRLAIAELLRKAVAADSHLKPDEAKAVLSQVDQP